MRSQTFFLRCPVNSRRRSGVSSNHSIRMELNPAQIVAHLDAAFAPGLAPFGFEPLLADFIAPEYGSRVFRSGDQYIKITINCDIRERIPFCNIILGDGSTDWPESDWNAIALWRLSGSLEDYHFKQTEDLPALFSKMAKNLIEQAEDFLSGNLNRFLMKRAEQTQNREPYKISAPKTFGFGTITDEPISEGLKERFSRPERS